jgi:hypothetical protein
MQKSVMFHGLVKKVFPEPNHLRENSRIRRNVNASNAMRMFLFSVLVWPPHQRVSNTMYDTTRMKVAYLNHFFDVILKHIFPMKFPGGRSFFFGFAFEMRRCVVTQSFCLSVRLTFPPNISFSLLKLLITTPMNKLSRKKLLIIMNN